MTCCRITSHESVTAIAEIAAIANASQKKLFHVILRCEVLRLIKLAANTLRYYQSLLPGPPRLRQAAFERQHLLEARPILHGCLKDGPQPAWRHSRVNEVIGQIWTPLVKAVTIQEVVARLLGGIEQIAIGVVLMLLTPWIPPIVKYLAA